MLAMLASLVASSQEALLSSPLMATLSISTFVLPVVIYLVFFTEWNAAKNPPPRLPILVPALTGRFTLKEAGPIEMVRQGFQKFGDIFRIRVAKQGITFLIGHEASRTFFEAGDAKWTQKEVYSFTVPVFGKGIVYDSPPSVMIQQLKFLRHGLTGIKMETYAPKILKETEDFFARWGGRGEIDLHEVMSELTILTASRCLLGKEVRESMHAEVAHHYKALNDGMTHLSVFFPYLPTPAHRKRDAARAAIVEIFGRVIVERRAAQASEEFKEADLPDDFLQTLIDARYRDGRELEAAEITGLLLAALFAGQHTSSITTTWVGLMLMDQWRELVPRLRAEQKRVLAKTGGKITFEAMAQSDLLHATVKEALRMFPPLVLLMRKVKEDTQYRGYTIPSGDIAVVCPPVAHRVPEVFANPDAFDPDRWLPPRNEGTNKYDFQSFGGGRHQCLGEKFGLLQIKTIWAVLIRDFDFELVGGENFVPKVSYDSIVSGPGEIPAVRFTRRKNDE